MSDRWLPVRPSLRQLRIEAEELVREGRCAKLADAQYALAKSYDAPSWARLVEACALTDAIWRDDAGAVERLITRNPRLIHEPALIRRDSSWGPPMSYAANLGRDSIIELLHRHGATDHLHALDRAALQGQIATARLIHRLAGEPRVSHDALEGPAYTLNAAGTALLFELGAAIESAPVHVVLESDSRRPADKHAILEMYASRGVQLPDTPPMAVHRGRIDLLEEHLRRDPSLLERTFAHEEIFPPELGCHDEVLATHGTPLKGATLLHMAIDYDEHEIARWLLDRGMSANVRAAVDEDGFDGHTPLFATVVAQPHYRRNAAGKDDDRFARLLLDRGADPNARASLRKQLHPGYGPDTLHEYRDVTPLAWGARFHDQRFVSRATMKIIEERGGQW